jgi:protein-disulfide isomerase
MNGAEFDSQKQLDVVGLRRLATALGLDMARFDRCTAGESKARVDADSALARSLPVTSTPTFFVGRLGDDGELRVLDRIPGAATLSRFRAAIDSALQGPRD